MIQIELPEGASTAKTNAVLEAVEEELKKYPEVENVMANLGRGNPRVYYNVTQRELATNIADAFVLLKAYEPKRTPQMLDEWRATFDTYPGTQDPGEVDGERPAAGSADRDPRARARSRGRAAHRRRNWRT